MKAQALGSILCLIVLAGIAQADTFQDLSARAAAAREANDIPSAVELYRQALRLNPGWQEGWWFLGTLLYDGNQFSEARDALKQLVGLNPKIVPAWGLLGLCEFETGEYTESLADIQRSLASFGNEDPQMGEVLRFHECMLLTRAGAFDKSLEKYAWFAKREVQSPELVSAIGLAALRAPLLSKEIPDRDRELYREAGAAAYLIMSGNYTEADRSLRELLQQFPTAHYVHFLYGNFLLHIQPDTAIQELRRELEITPSSAAANAMLAWALLDRSQAASALTYAKRAVQLKRDSATAQYVLGRSLVECEQIREGIQHLEAAIALDPTVLAPHVALATAYSESGQPKQARHEREAAMQIAKEPSIADR